MDNPWATESWQHPDPAPLPDARSDDWDTPWDTSETPPDQSEPAQDVHHAAPPEWLDTLLRHCQHVSEEIWPPSESSSEGNWRSGFDGLADITTLLAQLAPADPTLPPTVQFSATATAKAMNEALKLTRHLPASASSPLSRLLASKGSLEWQKSIKITQDVAPDTSRVGWRVLEKEDRLSIAEESKPLARKATGGFLSFWNRRTSTIQAAPSETPTERPSSPRPSLESVKPIAQPPSSGAASPPKPSTPSAPLPPSTDAYSTALATAPAPSAVSRFLNRFSRAKGSPHSALALSSDDLEFLSDIVPSASDPPDEDVDNAALEVLTSVSNLSPLPPKLPPPIPPPPKLPMQSARSSPAPILGTSNNLSVIGTTIHVEDGNRTPTIPPPLSPTSAASVDTQSLSFRTDAATPTITFGQPSTSSIQQRLPSSSQRNPQGQSSRTLSSYQTVYPLSIPPLLPPPPVSPPQTPRPSTFSVIASGYSLTTQSSDTSHHDADSSDDEFTAFASFPAPAPAPSLPSDPYPARRSPSPPSPPPRRTYEHTHYPSSSSTSSILSPASQSSVDQLCATKPSMDSFDDFVSPSSVLRNGKRTPPPPPLPAKPQLQHRQPPRIDTYPSRAYQAHTPSQSFASPTVHTSLMTGVLLTPSVSDVERQRAQALVNHAAARGGLLWPNSPELDESETSMTLPPPPTSVSSPSLVGEGFDLLGDGDTLGSGYVTRPAPPSVVGGVGMDSALRVPSGVASGSEKGLSLRSQLQPTPPPLFSSSSGLATPPAAINIGSSHAMKPKQTGGLSAQDLSFFEGL